MKKLAGLLALLLTVAMLAGCSLVTVNPDKVVVAKIGDQTITKAEFDTEFAAFLADYGYTVDSTEIADQLDEIKQNYIDVMVQDIVSQNKVKEYGLDQITDEEKAEIEEEIDTWYNESLQSLVAQFADEEDPEASAKDYLDSYLSQYGTSLEQMKADEIEALPLNKLYEKVTADVTVSDEELQAKYEEQVATDKELYSQDLSSFLTAESYGTTIYYVPEGCFYVKHILIALPTEQQDEISSLRADNDEAVAATADAKREEYLAGIAEEAQMVLDSLNNGTDFETLLAEFGDDPGMSGDYYPDGYLTYAGNPQYVTEFTAACDELTSDGMTSGLVASDYGYHIIRRVGTLASGQVSFEDVKEELAATMLDSAKEDAYTALLDTWVSEAKVELFTDKL